MAYDLVIKNGMLIDGSGLPRYRADVGVRHGRIGRRSRGGSTASRAGGTIESCGGESC